MVINHLVMFTNSKGKNVDCSMVVSFLKFSLDSWIYCRKGMIIPNMTKDYSLVTRIVTLEVAFCPKNLCGQGLTNVTLSFYECRLSCGDTEKWRGTQTLRAVIKFI